MCFRLDDCNRLCSHVTQSKDCGIGNELTTDDDRREAWQTTMQVDKALKRACCEDSKWACAWHKPLCACFFVCSRCHQHAPGSGAIWSLRAADFYSAATRKLCCHVSTANFKSAGELPKPFCILWSAIQPFEVLHAETQMAAM